MKYEKKVTPTFGHHGIHHKGSGHDHLNQEGITHPHGGEHGNPVSQIHRTVHSRHEHVHGAMGMESHGCIEKSGQTVGGGKGQAARVESDMPVTFRKSM